MTTNNKTPRPVLLAEYRAPVFLVAEVDLRIDLYDDHAWVRSRLRLRRNPASKQDLNGPANNSADLQTRESQLAGDELNLADPLTLANSLILDGEQLELWELRLNGVELGPEAYQVTGAHWVAAPDQALRANPDSGSSSSPDSTPGSAVEASRQALGKTGYLKANGPCRLIVFNPPDNCNLETVSRIFPAANTTLEGLYRSGAGSEDDTGSKGGTGAIFCTQCEPEGFRKITWYPDRPDVSAPFTVTISAAKQSCPVLLAGGNPIGRGTLAGGRHWASFQDPFPKPSYLFALVAGDLVGVHDSFTTSSGREIALAIYVEAHNRDKCHHAMRALQKAMRWDEETFGLEYDLDHYLIVAVDDFNMGAMENKGLNIFNARFVLASPESATDDDFEQIEAVIAHEYFHNWTGNRVTCRDWFQLSLKEGLTVFRDQLFSQDLGSAGVKRINEVRLLRERQFAEDAGPLAHPVRPESYLEINNFYTLTVYEKGSELVRMLHTLLGKEKFRRGLNLYLQSHDGGAATIEDFLAAMAKAGERDLSQFKHWYTLAGTPLVKVSDDYDQESGRYILRVEQSRPASSPPKTLTPAQATARMDQGALPQDDQSSSPALDIPLLVGLLAPDGSNLLERLLELKQKSAEFVFEGLRARPVPSLLRGFSAPVHLDYAYDQSQLRLILTHDSDPFCRWEAAQRLSCGLLLELIAKWRAGEKLVLAGYFIELYRQLLRDAAHQPDKSLTALLLTLPTENYLAEQMTMIGQGSKIGQKTKVELESSLAQKGEVEPESEGEPEGLIDVEAIHAVLEFVRYELARALRREWQAVYEENRRAAASWPPTATESYDPKRAGFRRLQNLALSFLLALAEDEVLALAHIQFTQADNMSDSLAALKGLVHGAQASNSAAALAVKVLADFAARSRDDSLVMDKWFTVQATVPGAETLNKVRDLMKHPAFNFSNPNRIRALIGAYAANPTGFHQISGSGYRFLAEQILALNSRNPQVAARLATHLSRWRRYDLKRQSLMRLELRKIASAPNLSRDLYEVVNKSLSQEH